MILTLFTAIGWVKADPVAQAVWCEGDHTLYFVYHEQVSVNDTFDGQIVTAVWSGEAVTNSYAYMEGQSSSSSSVAWYPTASSATTVKFDNTFKDVKPVTLHKWFVGFTSLSNIIGIENLNTSEVTSMESMFSLCYSLTSIDVSSFDMSKVTNVSGMFTACTSLATIFCNQTWSGIASSSGMFYNTKLKGYVKDSSPADISKANPFTGYFTTTPAMTGTGAENDPFIITDAAQWDALGSYVAAGNNCSGLYFHLGSDITVKTCIGADGKPFSGTFIGRDGGNQHVLTANIDEGTNYYAAPFAYIHGATIQNVYVKGTVKGGRHSAGLVGSIVANSDATIYDCRVATTVTTSDQYAGGVVGHGHSPSSLVDIRACLFEGTIKRESSGGKYAGAIMGWCDNKDAIIIRDCVENGSYTNFTNANLNYCHRSGSALSFDGYDSYNFHKWSTCKQALEIELDDDDVLQPQKPASTYPTSSIVTYEGGAMSYLPEPEDDDDLLVFAAAGNTFYFKLTGGTFDGVKDEDGNDVTYSGSDPNYSFTMPAKPVKVSADEGKAYVFRIGTNKLVFAYSEFRYSVGDTWEGEEIAALWKGNAVKNVGWDTPGWVTGANQYNIIYVVFDESFAQVKPRSTNRWFSGFERLTTITGIQNLNTSECTNMNSMFYGCSSLTSINVNNFDVSEVTNATTMFRSCSNLVTITCDNAWNIETADNMFLDCENLKNTTPDPDVTYIDNKVGCSMANPDTGYFTETEGASTIQGNGTESNPYLIGTARQWTAFANKVNDINNGDTYEGKYVKLTADINIGNVMVGTITADGNNITGGRQFKGCFDGNGHTITMALEGTSGELAVAPFRNVDAKISNLRVTGTISTSGKFAGSIVGRATYLKMTNCYSDVAITSTVSGDGSTGGLVGIILNPYYNYYGLSYPIEGCVFSGKLLGASTTHCGGFVGWVSLPGVALKISNSLYAPTAPTGSETSVGTSNSMTFVRSGGTTTSSQYARVENCYYTATLGTAQGAMVYEITDETSTVMPYNSTYYDASGMFVGGNMLMMFKEGYKYYGASSQTVQFTSSVSVTAKKTASSAAIDLSGNGTDATPYSFTMPAEAVTLSTADPAPYAIWCNGNKTLYFVTTNTNPTAGTYWGGNLITNIWSGNDVTKTGWGTPKWMDVANSATTVVFESTFANVKPNSLFKWFNGFTDLASIEGIQYLNTSEVTTMNATFADCGSLETLDVNGFDVSKVTNSTTMFMNCDDLTTIYCENTWNIGTSTDMFIGCKKLTGAVKYNNNKVTSTMANPLTGYFTWNKSLTLQDNADNTSVISLNDGTIGMTVTLSGRTFYKDGDWNTVCLPFGLNGSTFIDSPFSSAISIKELDVDGYYDGEGNRYDVTGDGRHQTGYDASTSTLYLYFKDVNFDDDTTDEVNYGDGMLAGVPYLVKWGNEGTNITNPVFTGVTINSTLTTVQSADEKVSFKGIYAPVEILSEGNKQLFYLGANSTLYWPNAAMTINSQRAYFELAEALSVKAFKMNIGADEATGIRTIDNSQKVNDSASDVWFTLDGRSLGARPTQRGIYIKNGKKMIIK